uniref:Secreted protein n=1 Tax=Macrostomum lignano TaxID=282301 RepID=A0A1I8F1W3_9PLAT
MTPRVFWCLPTRADNVTAMEFGPFTEELGPQTANYGARDAVRPAQRVDPSSSGSSPAAMATLQEKNVTGLTGTFRVPDSSERVQPSLVTTWRLASTGTCRSATGTDVRFSCK